MSMIQTVTHRCQLSSRAIRISGGALICVIALACSATLAANASKRNGIYRGFIVANTDDQGCYGPIGIYVVMDARASTKLSLASLRIRAQSDRPRHTLLRVRNRTYALEIDTPPSGVAEGRFWWTFKRQPVAKKLAPKLIGTIARITYTIAGRTYRAPPVRVADGNCDK